MPKKSYRSEPTGLHFNGDPAFLDDPVFHTDSGYLRSAGSIPSTADDTDTIPLPAPPRPRETPEHSLAPSYRIAIRSEAIYRRRTRHIRHDPCFAILAEPPVLETPQDFVFLLFEYRTDKLFGHFAREEFGPDGAYGGEDIRHTVSVCLDTDEEEFEILEEYIVLESELWWDTFGHRDT